MKYYELEIIPNYKSSSLCLSKVHKCWAKAMECIFIRYGNDKFGYKFWDSKNKKVIQNSTMVFLEYQTIKDLRKDKAIRYKSQEKYEKLKKSSTSK